MINAINPFDSITFELQSIKDELAGIRNVMASASTREKKFYTIPEAAAKLNVAEITCYRLAQHGKIPSKKVGSRVMVPGSFVDK